MMRFAIKQAGCGSERVGCLTGFVKASEAVIETPTSALLTQGGSVVHLTAEVLSKVFSSPQLLWVPLSNSIQLEPGVKAQGDGVAKFAGLPCHIVCSTLHSTNEVNPPGHFEQNKVPLWTKNGKKLVTADRYMDVMDVFKPDIILAIADGCTSLSEASKRISKSVDRTCSMLDSCVNRYKASKHLQESSLVGVIVGAGDAKKCDQCIQHILKYKETLSGVALAGITDGREESLKVPTEKLESILKSVGEALPKDLIRFVEGSWNPAVVVAAIEQGWDVFDGTYPTKLTNAGYALALNFDITRNDDELCLLDLNDVRYKEEFRPIVQDCECLACRKHTRAYIRHLLNTREMLASVLLSIHNLHHFDQMFLHARRHIAAKTFSLYKQHITKQYELYKVSQTTKETTEYSIESEVMKKCVENNSADGQDSTVQQNKKIRVSNDQVAHNT